MKATYAKHGADYSPAIRHDDGRIEVIHAGRWSLDESDATPYGRVLMALRDAVESVLVKRAGHSDQAEDITVSIY